jgi:SagB-type dehydrogenase family enzyme
MSKDFSIALAFHSNTMRWPFNTLEPGENWPDGEFGEYPLRDTVALPAPRTIDTSLSVAIAARLSCRSFTSDALTLEQLSALLFYTYGVEGCVNLGALEHLERPVPSGGGLYPLELYLLVQRVEGLAPGVYHYFPLCQALEVLEPMEVPHSVLTQLFLNQSYMADAAVVLVIAANLRRTMHKYEDRGYRYVLFEAGHAMQNMNLVAAALGVGGFNAGGFFDSYLANLLGIDIEKEVPLYCAGLGVPTTADRVQARDPNALFSDT